MNVPAESIECLLPGKNPFAICFERDGDQWIERWVFGREPSQKLILESVRTDGTDWPDNPPWQEVIREVHDGLPVIMAIGRAGKSHWSAAWKVLATAAVDVEYACRVHAEPDHLGTSFRMAREVSYDQVADNSLIMKLGNDSLRIAAKTGTSIDVSDTGRISFRPDHCDDESLPRTIQWRFRIE